MKLFYAPLLALLLAGCGANEAGAPMSDETASSAEVAAGAATAADAQTGPAAPGAPKGKSPSLGAITQAVSTTQRKIIYTATVDLVVENLSQGQTKLVALTKANQGYIAQTNVGGASGAQRQGSWKVRVPVDKYEAFMAGAAKLGELQTINSTSQDVTAEFYDVSARIQNKQVEEARLIELLKKATGKLSEILQVEKELSRVRGEIERLQGRIRVLANLSALTTITISMREIKDYVPPAPPSFATEIARQFSGSLGLMKDAGKGLILFGAAILPWLPVLALVGFPLWRVWRRSLKTPPTN